MKIGLKFRILVVLLVMGAMSQVAISQTLWIRETVDNPSDASVGYFSSTALDSTGRVHIAYFDFNHHSLKYAKKTASGAWVKEWIEPLSYPAGAGDLVSLAIDAGGQPHVTYQFTLNVNNPHVDLRYARRFCIDPVNDLGCMWLKDTIDAGVFATGAGGSTSLAIDGYGRPNVVYFDNWRGQLKWARREGSSWGITDVTPALSGRAAMVLDSNGFPRIVFSDEAYNPPLVRYAKVWCAAIVCGWNVETVGIGMVGNLALDTGGGVHVAYRGPGYSINYALKPCLTCAWNIQTIGSAGWNDVRPWVALLSDGSPRVIFADFSHVLYRARLVSDVWTMAALDSNVVPYADMSITIDSNNNAHVTYQSDVNPYAFSLKHATEFRWTETPRR